MGFGVQKIPKKGKDEKNRKENKEKGKNTDTTRIKGSRNCDNENRIENEGKKNFNERRKANIV